MTSLSIKFHFFHLVLLRYKLWTRCLWQSVQEKYPIYFKRVTVTAEQINFSIIHFTTHSPKYWTITANFSNKFSITYWTLLKVLFWFQFVIEMWIKADIFESFKHILIKNFITCCSCSRFGKHVSKSKGGKRTWFCCVLLLLSVSHLDFLWLGSNRGHWRKCESAMGHSSSSSSGDVIVCRARNKTNFGRAQQRGSCWWSRSCWSYRQCWGDRQWCIHGCRRSRGYPRVGSWKWVEWHYFLDLPRRQKTQTYI